MEAVEATQLAEWLSWAMMVIGPITLTSGLLLQRSGISAPYGRFSLTSTARGWGPLLPGRWAWMTQELPALLVPLCVLAWHQPNTSVLSTLQHITRPCNALAISFLFHYSYRSLIYPLRMRGPKRTALVVWAMATAFCCWNGYIQGWFLFHECPASVGPVWQVHHVVGLALWLTGWLLNYQADGILRNLRTSPTDTGYKIPRGGLFNFVSAANYSAECLEWTGWAVAASWPSLCQLAVGTADKLLNVAGGGAAAGASPHSTSGIALAPVAFALFTFCNLAPRARAHHAWYQDKFKGEYPAARKAIIPFVW